jgi:hypothetical protein
VLPARTLIGFAAAVMSKGYQELGEHEKGVLG